MTAPNEQAAAAALQCGQCADNALPPRLIPFWPFGTPQQFHSCVTIRLTAEARPLLLRIRNDLLAALRGARSQEPWARGLKPARLIAMLRQLSFVMLGPLWEDAYRFPQTCRGIDPLWSLPDDWTPGSLPPEITAPALLASATFLAAESRTRLEGVTWNPRLLFEGEGEHIAAATLMWHLNRTDAEWVRRVFGAPVVHSFAVLLAALRSDHRGPKTAAKSQFFTPSPNAPSYGATGRRRGEGPSSASPMTASWASCAA
jgi:hypothetical protein